MYKFFLIFIFFLSNLSNLFAEDTNAEITIKPVSSVLNYDINGESDGLLNKQLESFNIKDQIRDTRLNVNKAKSFFSVLQGEKICIGGADKGKVCSVSTDCDTGLCFGEDRMTMVIAEIENVEAQFENKSLTFPMGISIDANCTGFTVGLMEKVQMFIAAIMEYVTKHLLQNILTKVFGIPSLSDPGAIMKWGVDMLAQLTCFVKAGAVTAVETAGDMVTKFVSYLLKTVDEEEEQASGPSTTKTTTSDKDNTMEKDTSTNTAGTSKTVKKVTEEAGSSISSQMDICVREVKSFFNKLLTEKIGNNLFEMEAWKYKSACEMAEGIETVEMQNNHNVDKGKISLFYTPKKSYDYVDCTSMGWIDSCVHKTNNGDKTDPSDSEVAPIRLEVDYDRVLESLEDNQKIATHEVECPDGFRDQHCKTVQRFLKDIDSCIHKFRTSSIETDDICSFISCEDSTSDTCYLKYKFNGYGNFVTDTTTNTTSVSVTPETKVEYYRPFIPLPKFENKGDADGEVDNNIFTELLLKKDICLILEAQGKVGAFRIINSYIMARALKNEIGINYSSFETDYKPSILNMHELYPIYDNFVKDYCNRTGEASKILLEKKETIKLAQEIQYEVLKKEVMRVAQEQSNLEAPFDVYDASFDSKDKELIKVCAWAPGQKKTAIIYKSLNLSATTPAFSAAEVDVDTISSSVSVSSGEDISVHLYLSKLPTMITLEKSVSSEKGINRHIDSFVSPGDNGVNEINAIIQDISLTKSQRLDFVTKLNCRYDWGHEDSKDVLIEWQEKMSSSGKTSTVKTTAKELEASYMESRSNNIIGDAKDSLTKQENYQQAAMHTVKDYLNRLYLYIAD